jgi:hypothetical protein
MLGTAAPSGGQQFPVVPAAGAACKRQLHVAPPLSSLDAVAEVEAGWAESAAMETRTSTSCRSPAPFMGESA